MFVRCRSNPRRQDCRRGQGCALLGLVLAGLAIFVLPFILGPAGMAFGIIADLRGERRGRWVIALRRARHGARLSPRTASRQVRVELTPRSDRRGIAAGHGVTAAVSRRLLVLSESYERGDRTGCCVERSTPTTMSKMWGLGEPFSRRDATARTFDHVFTLDAPRDPAEWATITSGAVPDWTHGPRASSARP